MKKSAISVVYCLFLLISCTFEPEGENIVPLDDTPSAIVRNIDLLQQADTIQLFIKSTTLHFEVQVENNDTIWIELSIDDRVQRRYEASKGSFILDVSKYSEGYHKLRLDVVTNSGTGSLVDVLGGELLLWSREWTFFFQYEKAEPVKILEVYPEKGQLVIKWEEGMIPSEKLLTIYSERKLWEYTITDPYQTSLTDGVYVGGDIEVRLKNISLDPQGNSPITYYKTEFPSPAIKAFTSNEYGHINISWHLPLFYQNISHIEFRSGSNILHQTTGKNDSTAVLAGIPFDSSPSLEMRTVSSYEGLDFGNTVSTSTYTNLYVGNKVNFALKNFVHAPHAKEKGFQFAGTAAVLFKDSIAKEIDDVGYMTKEELSITSNGDHIYFCDSEKVSKLDRNGNIEAVVSSMEIFGEIKYFRSLAVSNERYLAFTHSSFTENLYMYDLVEKRMIFDFPMQGSYNSSFNVEFSIDGSFLVLQHFNSTQLFSVINGVIQDTVTFHGTDDFILDAGEDQNLILLTSSSGKFEVYNLATKNLRSFTIEETKGSATIKYYYDLITGNIGVKNELNYLVINPTTGELLRNILINGYTEYYGLYDGSLYFMRRKLDLKLN